MGREYDPFIGKQLGPYQIQSKLGEGGMARVYKGYHLRLRREVAIKLILSQVADHDGFQARFEREAQVIASLEHPNIVSVHDFGEADNLTYLVMQYVGGGTLREQLHDKRPLEVARAINYTAQIAHALSHAHQRGIIHRDVKPANMLISATHLDHVLLSDFGIAKLYWSSEAPAHADMPTQSSNSDASLTSADQIIGTADYMSPEQANGLPVDARADIYALGIVLYHMLTGEVPFHSTTLRGLLFQHVYTLPPSVRDKNSQIPEILARITAKAMAKAPEERFQTAEAMASALTMANTYMTHPQISLPPDDLAALQLSLERPLPQFSNQQTAMMPQSRPNLAPSQNQSTADTLVQTQFATPGTMSLTNGPALPTTSPGITDSRRSQIAKRTRKGPFSLSYLLAALLIVCSLILVGTRVVPTWLAQSPQTISQSDSSSTSFAKSFSETFQDNSRNWQTGSLNNGITASISDYQYTLTASQSSTAFVFPQSVGALPQAFTLTTTIEQKAGAKNILYGLAFRFAETSTGVITCYALLIDSSGVYQIREYGNGYTNTSQPLWQGYYTSTGTSHTLEVKATTNDYTFSIDGKQVKTGSSSTMPSLSTIQTGGLALLVAGQQITLSVTKVQLSES